MLKLLLWEEQKELKHLLHAAFRVHLWVWLFWDIVGRNIAWFIVSKYTISHRHSQVFNDLFKLVCSSDPVWKGPKRSPAHSANIWYKRDKDILYIIYDVWYEMRRKCLFTTACIFSIKHLLNMTVLFWLLPDLQNAELWLVHFVCLYVQS